VTFRSLINERLDNLSKQQWTHLRHIQKNDLVYSGWYRLV
jgi:hypothetical protein